MKCFFVKTTVASLKPNVKNKILLATPFLAAEIVLYGLFLAEDFWGASVGDNVLLKYTTVMLAFLFSAITFLLFDRQNFKDGLLLVLSLALTMTADLFLLVLDDHYIVGVVVFFGAQLCHFARIERNKIWLVVSLSARVVLSATIMGVLAALKEASALKLVVAVYFVWLVSNFFENVVAIFVAKTRAERRKHIVLSVAFLLFLGCDLSVGLANLYGVAGEFEWLFYTPSQVLMALSLGRMYETENN